MIPFDRVLRTLLPAAAEEAAEDLRGPVEIEPVGVGFAQSAAGLALGTHGAAEHVGLLFNGVGKQLSRLTESMIRPMQGQWLPAPSVLLNDNGSRNYWSVYNTAEQNAAASYPRLSHQGGEYNNYKMSDYWLKSSAYMRIKNINVGYTVPKKIVSKVGIKGLRVYVNIDDPYCFDSYLSGWDPEAGASTYITRTYTFGVDIKF